MINVVNLAGNLTRDMEVKSTASGSYVGNFSIAVNERRPNKQSGEWEDHPHFFDCVMFGERARKLAKYFTKGTKLSISGKLSQNRWEDQNGNNRSKVEVIVNDFEFMSGRRSDQDAKAMIQDEFPGATVYDEDIPF